MSESININDVFKEIEKSDKSEYHRGKSWEHCYIFFRNYKKFGSDTLMEDYAALHLGFFLASWGMLRGSSFLLQKDYRYFLPVVRVLIKDQYKVLWNVGYLNLNKNQESEIIDILFWLKDDICKVMTHNNPDGRKPTDLLITKIIMATMGCVPAYDQYFKAGLKRRGIKNNFSKKAFIDLLNFSRKKLEKLYIKKQPIKGTNYNYPTVKLIDLYFWLLGSQK